MNDAMNEHVAQSVAKKTLTERAIVAIRGVREISVNGQTPLISSRQPHPSGKPYSRQRVAGLKIAPQKRTTVLFNPVGDFHDFAFVFV
ncbi:hypothetical protein Bpro_4458 [Polaromonas sp. JS666]|nr:hypothetical protein Bpro_4458 [Polaromonas sp. JS666]